MSRALRAVAVAAGSAFVFAALASLRIEAQGLYYDESFQVPAVFAWMGRPPGGFCRAILGDLPLLNMSYVGALKSALYAGYLSVTDRAFTVANWRGFAVATVTLPLFAFLAVLGARRGPRTAFVFAALWMTDMTVLLTTRHDWGPTALSMALRLSFLAAWLYDERLSARRALLMGLFVGLAVYDKVSSVVLLAPLALALFGAGRREWAAAACGLALGTAPLALANAVEWTRSGELISLADASKKDPRDPLGHFWGFVTVGSGSEVRRWILDLPTPPMRVRAEGVLVIGVSLALLLRRGAPGPARRLIAAYALVAVALFALPRRSEAHHWILGTPFHYAAIALAVSDTSPARRTRLAAAAAVFAMLLVRWPTVAETVGGLAGGQAGRRFHPALTEVAKRAVSASNVMVVAATWGIGNQVQALAQGRPNAVWEPFKRDEEWKTWAERFVRERPAELWLINLPWYERLHPEHALATIQLIEGHPWYVERCGIPTGTDHIRIRRFERVKRPPPLQSPPEHPSEDG